MICEISGCGRLARWQLFRPDSTLIHTCEKCRDELIARFGYRLA